MLRVFTATRRRVVGIQPAAHALKLRGSDRRAGADSGSQSRPVSYCLVVLAGPFLTGIVHFGTTDPNNTSQPRRPSQSLRHRPESIEGRRSDITRLVRGGYRAVWSDTRLQSLASGEDQAVSLRRNVGLAGFGFRLPRKADVSLDFEAGEGNRVYSRTDILDYRKIRLRGRYRPWEVLTVSGALVDGPWEYSSRSGYDFRTWVSVPQAAPGEANACRRTRLSR